ncbi:MAG: GNAT family N-acetyltransferase [Myxococcota bacterium]
MNSGSPIPRSSVPTVGELCQAFPFGRLRIRDLDPPADRGWLHDWVRRDYARFWGMMGKSVDAVEAEYVRLLARSGYEVIVGEVEEQPLFIGELYDPRTDAVGKVYAARDSDRGIHFIAAPPCGRPLAGFTTRSLNVVLAYALSSARISRLLVEPDARNEKMIQLCRRLGFCAGRIVELPEKTARLMFLDRDEFNP